MSKYRLDAPLEDVDPLIMPGVNAEKPCIFIFFIDGKGTYVGKSSGKNPTYSWQKRYSARVQGIIDRKPYHGDPNKNYRPIHYALFEALKEKLRVTLIILENGKGDALIERRKVIKAVVEAPNVRHPKKEQNEYEESVFKLTRALNKSKSKTANKARSEKKPKTAKSSNRMKVNSAIQGRGQKNLDELAKSLYQETWHLWRDVRKEIPEIGERGYEVLNGPPILHPDIFFLSLNPGFSRATQISQGWTPSPRRWPDQLGYIKNPSDFAVKFRQIFAASADLKNLIDLKRCNASYTMFFRSKDWDEWKNILREKPATRKRIEANCLAKVHELIELSKPKLIITFGEHAFKKTATKKNEELDCPWGEKSLVLFRLGEHNGVKLIGLPHISGVRLSSEHIDKIPKFIAAKMNELS